MKVTVVGQGYVGLTLSVAAAQSGHNVVGFDVDQNLINNLLLFQTYVPGVESSTLKNLIGSNRYLPTSDFKSSKDSEIFILAVPTPLDSFRKPDLTLLIKASKLIAANSESSALIINESTSYPGTLRNIIKPIFDENSSIKFEFAAAPERVDPGNLTWKMKNTPRVIAGLDTNSTNKAVEFYSSFCTEIFTVSSAEVAEASKVFENTFRQINIALVNEFAQIAEAIGFSAHESILAASTKPFGFMPFYPSIGVGGHCIPIDPSYLSYIAKQNGSQAQFIDLANRINLNMPNFVAEKIKKTLGGSLKDKRIQIAGIAYKGGVQDLRESPALDFMSELKKLGAIVSWHDPLVKEYSGEASSDLDPKVDLGVIISPHVQIDFSIWRNKGTNVLDLSPTKQNYGWPKFL